jgi:Tfp pilus assembly protein PilF
MQTRLNGIGLALFLGMLAQSAWAAGKVSDACFANDASDDETIAGCNAVLSQRKREMTTTVVVAFYNRGLAYAQKNETERAIKDFSEALKLDPSYIDGFDHRGSAYYQQEQYDLALSDYDAALKLDPKHTSTLINRGWTFSSKGEPERAIKDFDAAIVLDPKSWHAYYNRGLAYEKMADPVRAQADLETAARLDPDNEDGQTALKRVRAVVQAQPTASAPSPAAQKASPLGSSVPDRGAAPSGPATLADLEAQEKATAAVWERLPFSTRHAMFVTRKANAYGDYDARPSNVFAPGEKLLSYMEPVGYAYAAEGNGLRFGVSIDFEILSKDGKVLTGQKDILKQEFASHDRNREFFFNGTMSMDGAPPGDYVLAYILHDLGSARTTRVEQPFKIEAPAAVTR